MDKKNKKGAGRPAENEKFPFPNYKEEDDIYTKGKREPLQAEDEIGKAGSIQNAGNLGSVLDVPGSELDDADETIGEEDEENNYYSLGGDNHDDLEEDKS